MNISDNVVKLVAGVACAIVLGLCVWGWHAWPDTKELLMLIINATFSVLAGLGVYHAATRDSGGEKGGGQGGFASVRLLMLVALVAALAIGLSGCAGPTNAFVSGLMSQEASNVKGTDDNAGKVTVFAFCHLPLDLHQRNPAWQPARDTLCGPMASDPNKIDAHQLTLLMGVLRASGATLQAAPAK